MGRRRHESRTVSAFAVPTDTDGREDTAQPAVSADVDMAKQATDNAGDTGQNDAHKKRVSLIQQMQEGIAKRDETIARMKRERAVYQAQVARMKARIREGSSDEQMTVYTPSGEVRYMRTDDKPKCKHCNRDMERKAFGYERTTVNGERKYTGRIRWQCVNDECKYCRAGVVVVVERNKLYTQTQQPSVAAREYMEKDGDAAS